MPEEKLTIESVIRQTGVVQSHAPHSFFEISPLHVYRLDRGCLKIVHVNSEGQRHVKYVIMAGEWFGALAFLLKSERTYMEYAMTTEYVQTTLVPVEQARALCKED